MKFARYDKDNFMIKISKEETKKLFDFLDEYLQPMGFFEAINEKIILDFMTGLKNLSSSSSYSD